MAQHRLDDETALLYNASTKLTRASTPLEQLEAVSDYPRSSGATRGVLFYFEFGEDVRTDVVAAEWNAGTDAAYEVGTRIRLAGLENGLIPPEGPVLVGDTRTDRQLSSAIREIDLNHHIYASVVLPLFNSGRWVAAILFGWNEPRVFDERDRRIYTVLQQLAAPVVDSVRLFEQTQKRAAELETAKHEMDILYNISRQLVRATTPAEILDAVSVYARAEGAVFARLSYFVDFQPHLLEIVAVWPETDGQIPTPVGTLVSTLNRKLLQHSMSRPDQPTFAIDLLNSGLLSPDFRAQAATYNARAVVQLPMYVKGRWIGVLTFNWDVPRNFDERDERIYAALQQQAAPVIDSLRLLDQSRARTLELEQANQEMNLLYRTSEIINSANTFQEVVEAVAPFDPDADTLALMLWEGLNWETASYIEMAVVIDRTGSGFLKTGDRLPKDNFPIARRMFDERVWLIEDAENDPRVDPVTVESWRQIGIRSFMGRTLNIQNQWIGGVTFHSPRPRKYTEREERLLGGIGDLVIAAVQRIRSQHETEAAKEEVDKLYRVGEAINAANSFSELVNALSGIIPGVDGVALYRWEGWDFDTASSIEMIAATGYVSTTAVKPIPKEILSYTEQNYADRLIMVEDVRVEPRYDPETIDNFLRREMMASISIRLHVNMRWIGALVFHSRTPRTFSEQEQRLAVGVGDYVLGAVERIRAREETEAARQRAEAFAQRAHQLAVLEERNRLARELHDSVSQALYGIVLGAQTARTFLDRDPQQAVEPLDYVLALSEAGLAEMRALIFELRPETLEKEGLIEALTKQVTMLQARHGLEVRTAFGPEPNIAIQHKEAVYWIAREALHNVVKHAHASVIELSVTTAPDSLALSIADDGTGFNIDGDYSGHLGLKSMSERAANIGGTLHVLSGAGSGTRIELRVPIE